MTDKQLVAQLRKMKLNTKGVVCLGCEHENNCSIHGCTVIGIAVGTIEKYDAGLMKPTAWKMTCSMWWTGNSRTGTRS